MTQEERKTLAVDCHGRGYNCCQSVLLACRDQNGMDEKMAVSLGYGFGSGMHCGEVCGALTGGLMAVGASMPDGTTQENRPQAAEASRELERLFRARFGSLLCRDILQDNGKRICDECISCGAEAAGEVIEKLKRGEYQK